MNPDLQPRRATGVLCQRLFQEVRREAPAPEDQGAQQPTG